MNIYTLDNAYIDRLRKIEDEVSYNKGRRHYIGVVLSIKNIDYFAPMSSKDFQTRRPNHSFILISKTKNLGVVHINNMLPVVDKSVLKLIKPDTEKDKKYASLLRTQLRLIRREEFKRNLNQKAVLLYEIVTKETGLNEKDIFLKGLSNNFKKLEKEALKLYNKKMAEELDLDDGMCF